MLTLVTDSGSYHRPGTRLTLRSVAVAPEQQPGNRACAPGELRLVQSFVNTRWNLDGHHEDRFKGPAAVVRWLAERELLSHGASLSMADYQRVLAVRDGLWAMLLANNGAAVDAPAIARLNRVVRRSGLAPRLGATPAPDFVVTRRDLHSALALLATIVAVAQLEGRWLRLKACRGHDCGWTFYDESRNQSGTWCSMSVCGSRAKASAYRQRRKA